MDIAKYIGLFLLKNNFCYLHGLGNLELKKKPAVYDGDALRAPEYDVVLSPGGSIDDTLANFIATHEQTSISKAANALREFSTATRAELAAGKEVEIPGVGKFVEVNGIVRFVANPHFQHVPTPVPMIRMAKRTEEQPDFHRDAQEEVSGGEIAWGKIILIALLAVLVVVGAIFAYRYFSNNGVVSSTSGQDTVIAQPAAEPSAVVTPIDTLPRVDTAAPAPVSQPAITSGDYTIVLNSYSSRVAAERRVTTLTKNGNKVEMLARDSSNYLVVMHMPVTTGDTTKMLDSLRRFFNPKGVHILH
jgi:nucleoid DNA-binding protein